MAGKKKLPRWTTPKGTAIYPYLDKPDTKFDKAGVYRVNLALSEADAEGEIERLKTVAKQALKDAKEKNAKHASKITLADLPYGTDEKYPGKIIFKFKMKAKVETEEKTWTQHPALFDATGTPITEPPRIGTGSEVRVAYLAAPYYSAKDKEAGVTLRLVAVQLIKLVEWGGGDAASFGFGEEADGFSAAVEAEDSDDLEDVDEGSDAESEDEF